MRLSALCRGFLCLLDNVNFTKIYQIRLITMTMARIEETQCIAWTMVVEPLDGV